MFGHGIRQCTVCKKIGWSKWIDKPHSESETVTSVKCESNDHEDYSFGGEMSEEDAQKKMNSLSKNGVKK